mmetsp:Transcript_9244/g.10454  ORF Transcript_9244/g.10454 Transcript_9244/m.10454 type:complete len:249 (+) Transcript_9244:24-770(+)
MNKFTAILFLAMIVGSALGAFPISISNTGDKQKLDFTQSGTDISVKITHNEGVIFPETAADKSSSYYACGVSTTSSSLSTQASLMAGFGYLYTCEQGDAAGDLCSASLDQTKLTLKHFTLNLLFTETGATYKGDGMSSPGTDLNDGTELIVYDAATSEYSFSHVYTSNDAGIAGLPTTGDEFLRCYFKYAATGGVADLAGLSAPFTDGEELLHEYTAASSSSNNTSGAFFTTSVASTVFIAMLASFIY